ncbi:TetR/AcrR family transcriptional regulator [Gulosibacter molinativorax]|uniref:TetR family transcriptional regulator n=1 Tax=Gulosibacter molinativorax TaxID=256821 RepID=A0ABT7CAI3_9MICO|nr:TetR/AcrR family transcriptional regulator [Gulosibacter molinativorax]MDJ1372167.1 TetR family transcriptional regulator [Gulosibacter molinativorax]QUY60962.1 HTH-type transcriptional regulator EthR [Gulosibacter molinativorax]
MTALKRRAGAGRPAASSHTALEEAACELALEQGWDNVSANDIAQRAGVSRSSFFNYFASKADVLWRNVDVALDSAASLREFVARLEEIGPPTALTYIDAMGARGAAEESSVARANRLAAMLRGGPTLGTVSSQVDADQAAALATSIQRIRSASLASGTLTAIVDWAASGLGRAPLHRYLDAAFGDNW